VFGVSFPELLVLGTVALLVLGPDKLPGMLRTLGNWLAKLRRLTTEVRHQSGIDDVLRAEGFEGGLNELRGLMRGGVTAAASSLHTAHRAPAAADHFVADKSREYPEEGPDAYGALPEDLIVGAVTPLAAAAPVENAHAPEALLHPPHAVAQPPAVGVPSPPEPPSEAPSPPTPTGTPEVPS
jgi:sec-independent protein translocase protein TatB